MAERSPRQQAKQAQIRDAARRLFLERGYARTSMDAVTAAAGVSKQTLYAYYPSKRALFADVLAGTSVSHPQYSPLAYLKNAQPATCGELQEVLTEFADRAVKTMMQPEYVSLLRVLIPEVGAHPELGDVFRAAVVRQGIDGVAAFLDDATRRGIIGPVDTNAVARLILGPLVTYLMLDGLLAPEQPVSFPDHERIAALVVLVVRALPDPDSETHTVP